MTHTWKIYDLERLKADGVVTKVTYGCETNDGDFSARKIGEFTLTGAASDDGFIAYDDLSEGNVLGWVDSNVDKAAIEAELVESINNNKLLIAAETTATGTPW
jgi:hypothetical protein